MNRRTPTDKMLETRKVDKRPITRKDTQGAFRKPTSIICNGYVLHKECSGYECIVLFIVQR